MEDFIYFNLNNYVKVKLTENGRQKMAYSHNDFIGTICNQEYRTADYYKILEDEDGYYTFQMWSFIEEFGEDIRKGDEYFDINVLIATNTLFK